MDKDGGYLKNYHVGNKAKGYKDLLNVRTLVVSRPCITLESWEKVFMGHPGARTSFRFVRISC